MTAAGHLTFAATCTLLAHKLGLTPALAAVDLYYALPVALLAGLLPDLDHPESYLGYRFKILSLPIGRIFGHRGFTHSLLAVALIYTGLLQIHHPQLTLGLIQVFTLGYASHIVADCLTPAGVPLLWPFKYRWRLPLLPSSSKSPLPEMLFCSSTLAAVGYLYIR